MKVAEEMADRIFTPERRQCLIDRLSGYIGQLPDDDEEGKQGARATIVEIQSHSTPRESYFLVSVCCKSLMTWMRSSE